jgi:hypothetical protein
MKHFGDLTVTVIFKHYINLCTTLTLYKINYSYTIHIIEDQYSNFFIHFHRQGEIKFILIFLL